MSLQGQEASCSPPTPLSDQHSWRGRFLRTLDQAGGGGDDNARAKMASNQVQVGGDAEAAGIRGEDREHGGGGGGHEQNEDGGNSRDQNRAWVVFLLGLVKVADDISKVGLVQVNVVREGRHDGCWVMGRRVSSGALAVMLKGSSSRAACCSCTAKLSFWAAPNWLILAAWSLGHRDA